MATSTIKNLNHIELLASAVDEYAMTWKLLRCGRTYILNISKTDQTIAIPSGALNCPFTVDNQWLPSQSYLTSSITQRGNGWNISIDSSRLSGWNYQAGDFGQRFAQLVWFK